VSALWQADTADAGQAQQDTTGDARMKEEIIRCRRCGEVLESERSRRLGIGQRMLLKYGAENRIVKE